MLIRGAKVFCADCEFHAADVRVSDGYITEVGANLAAEEQVREGEGCYLTPGLVDIHVHGAVGEDTSDGTLEGLQKIARFQLSQGVTSFLPTTVALPEAALRRAAEAVGALAGKRVKGAATIRGMNMEGPFFSVEKKGAHAAEHIIDFDFPMFQRLQAASGNSILLVDGAPERPGGLEFIRALKGNRARFSVAHTMAAYEQALAAYDAGARNATHLFNAMPPLHHREPGVIAAAAERAEFVELISDGEHVHPAIVRAVFTWFGAERLCLISDALRGMGMPDGDYMLGGLPIHIAGGAARLTDGTIAGSSTSLAEGMRRAMAFGIPKEQAVRAATINPARAVGLEAEIGSIEPGKQAELALWDEAFQLIEVIQ